MIVPTLSLASSSASVILMLDGLRLRCFPAGDGDGDGRVFRPCLFPPRSVSLDACDLRANPSSSSYPSSKISYSSDSSTSKIASKRSL